MIPLDIDDPVVLRRTLEEIEASIPNLKDTTGTITILAESADLVMVIDKVNELVGTVNLLSAALNSTD